MTADDDTRSRSRPGPAAAAGGPYLALAMQYARPLAAAERRALGCIAQLDVGRGRARALTADQADARWAVDDAWMSTRHARFQGDDGGWTVEDLGSKNGLLVNGAPTTRARLADHDRIEIGDTMFVFRARTDAPAEPHLTVAPVVGAPPALACLNPDLRAALATMLRVAAAGVPIVLSGPTGSGKEVTARAIHALARRPGNFVAVNCAAIPATLIESELFGVRRGAYSGADRDRPGLIVSADHGTLFLDELGEMPIATQAALLRALQEREVVPVGGTTAIGVSFGLVSATHRDVDALVADGRLRADLVARVRGHQVHLPPLADRREDLGLLVGALLARSAGEQASRLRFARAAARQLFTHPWPGNVRELDHALRVAVALAVDDVITPTAMAQAITAPMPAPAAPRATATPDRDAATLAALFAQHQGNLSAVARALGTSVSQVRRLLDRHQLAPRPPRA